MPNCKREPLKMNCKNCNTEINQNFCPQCGQPAKPNRIDGHYVQHEIEHLLHFERGILYTLRELIIRPSQSIKQFITDDRNRLVKPIIFVIITSLIYSFVNSIFHVEVGFIHIREEKQTAIGAIFKWAEGHYGYANLFFGIFIAAYAKLLFRKYGYNFFEILILMCYVLGVQMLIFSVFTLISSTIKLKLMVFAVIISLFYTVWVISHFFDKTKILNYFKALFTYFAGMATAAGFLILVGMLIEVIKKR